MVNWLEELAALLGKKGDALYQELKKLMDKVVEWLKKNSKNFERNKVSKSNYDEIYQQYGSLIAKGNSRLKKKYIVIYKKIVKESDSEVIQKKFQEDLVLKKPKPKNPKIYLQRRKQAYVNFKKGESFEIIFLKEKGGIKPNYSIKTALTNRFPDNIKNSTSRELKTGYVKNTKEFKKQFKKDIDILSRDLSKDISTVEWHIIEGIDESALKFIQENAEKSNVLDKITIVLY